MTDFSRQSAWNEALGLSYGATPTSRNRLKERDFFAMKVPLPPLEDQRRIVAKIEHLAAKIDEVHGLRAKSLTEADVLRRTMYWSAEKRAGTFAGDMTFGHHTLPTLTYGMVPRHSLSFIWSFLQHAVSARRQSPSCL